MLVFALLGPRIAARRSPRTVAQLGLVAVSIGAIVMLATLDVTLNDTGFKVALALIGAGGGLLASQLGNVIMSSVAPAKSSEGGGLQGTAQNLGSSLGTAIIGAVLLASLATGFSRAHRRQPRRPGGRARDDRRERRAGDRHRARRGRREGGGRGWAHPGAGPAPSPTDYGDAQLEALRLALGAVALAALLSLWFTRRLPTEVARGGRGPRHGAGGGRLDGQADRERRDPDHAAEEQDIAEPEDDRPRRGRA